VFINSATERSLDLISQRASDVYKAFTPGALPEHSDVETDGPSSRSVLDPLAVSAPEDDYFITSDDRGRATYTRDGELRIVNATLVGSNGRAVLGYGNAEGGVAPLKIDAVDDALGRARNVRIESDGDVVYDRRVVEPRTGQTQLQRVTIGRLALARFPAATKLLTAGDGTLAPAPGVIPHTGRPGDGNFGVIAPMRRDESRIDFDRSLERLHDAYVAFDALQAAHKAQGQTGKVAMDLLK
jgi:flagellar basal body rod protein FlgG